MFQIARTPQGHRANDPNKDGGAGSATIRVAAALKVRCTPQRSSPTLGRQSYREPVANHIETHFPNLRGNVLETQLA